MVGRLVEQHQVGRAHQRAGELQAHPPAAGEARHRRVELGDLEAEAEQHRLRARPRVEAAGVAGSPRARAPSRGRRRSPRRAPARPRPRRGAVSPASTKSVAPWSVSGISCATSPMRQRGGTTRRRHRRAAGRRAARTATTCRRRCGRPGRPSRPAGCVRLVRSRTSLTPRRSETWVRTSMDDFRRFRGVRRHGGPPRTCETIASPTRRFDRSRRDTGRSEEALLTFPILRMRWPAALAAALCVAVGPACSGSVVSCQVRAHDRRLRARRLDRQAGARAGAAHGRAARPDRRHREPARRGGQHRRRAGRDGAGRRLHRLPGHRQQPGDQSAPVFEAEVRPDQELRADRPGRQVPAAAGRRAAAAARHGAGTGGLRARESGQDVLRLVGQRVAGAPRRRDRSACRREPMCVTCRTRAVARP